MDGTGTFFLVLFIVLGLVLIVVSFVASIPMGKWEKVGCYKDQIGTGLLNDPARAFPYNAGTLTFKKCQEFVARRNFNTLAMSSEGECWYGTNPEYDRYGQPETCSPTDGTLVNTVYVNHYYDPKK